MDRRSLLESVGAVAAIASGLGLATKEPFGPAGHVPREHTVSVRNASRRARRVRVRLARRGLAGDGVVYDERVRVAAGGPDREEWTEISVVEVVGTHRLSVTLDTGDRDSLLLTHDVSSPTAVVTTDGEVSIGYAV